MQGVFFQNGLRVIRQVLDWFQTSKDNSDKERRLDYASYGIIKLQLNEFDIIAGTNNTPPTPSIWINTGVAYDVNGERIIIDDETISYDPTNPTDTTNDGLGNLILTPHSTGSKNVPLTVNVNNYIWIDYLQTTDESVFSLHKITRAKQFYKLVDGYEITVELFNTPPTVNSLKLGNVDLTGSGVVSPSTIFKTNRVYSLVKENTVKIHTSKADRSDATTNYVSDMDYVLDDHIKAVGTGTVAPTNPHGLTPIDIGLNTQEILETHQKFMHTSGIIGDRTLTTSSLYLSLQTVTPGDDWIIIRKLTTSEVALVNGITTTNTDIPLDITLLFSSITDPIGTYWVYVDKTTKSVQRTNVSPLLDTTKLTLWAFTWTPNLVGPDGNITAITDLRIFGTLDSIKLYDGSVSIPSLSFSSDPNTGIYRGAPDVLNIASGGINAVAVYIDGTYINNGQLFLQGGTSLLPSLTFTGDTNTGMYRVGADQLGLTTNGTQRVVINDIGNMGLGSSAPIAGGSGYTVLEIKGTANSNSGIIRFVNPDGGNGLSMGNILFTDLNGGSSVTGSAGIQGIQDGVHNSSRLEFSTMLTGASTINAILDKNGQFKYANGAAATPSISFINDPNTGIYSGAADQLAFSTNSTLRFDISTTAVTSTLPIVLPLGAAATPSITFTGDTNTGIWSSGADVLKIAVGGTSRCTFDVNGFAVAVGSLISGDTIKLENGAAATPVYSFTSDTNTGIYRNGTHDIGIATNGIKALNIDGNQKWFYQGFQLFPILQTVTSSTTTTATTSSTIFVNSNLAVTITPKFSTSLIYIIATGQLNSAVSSGFVTIARGTSNLFGNIGVAGFVSGNTLPFTAQVLDNPATTAATTYNIQFRVDAGGTAAFPTNTFGATPPTAYITAIEIAQ